MPNTRPMILLSLIGAISVSLVAGTPLMNDPGQILERTCFQTGAPYSDAANARSDVAICYGIDPGLPGRIKTWRDRGYRIHVMTGVSWGQYQDYLYGRFDGVNHEDEAQTERNGNKVSHGGDVYYMCPGENYGKFLCVGVQRALDAGAEAIHLEEPEFWVRSGYSEGFKREWRKYYGEEWMPPHESVDAQWRSSKLKYYLYRRALQQVFDHVQEFNRKTGRKVRCYVPTHSLVNYAHWRIVSPESSLARLKGCDGYIAQVWTGTSRTPNVYRGALKERTFETAFIEYGAMQNLVRSTGRAVWYLNDPVEDNPDYDWTDYQRNWESTLTASLLQPEVWRYEVAPWPERVFAGRYPGKRGAKERVSIPPDYATELQTVFNAMTDMNQKAVKWECGTQGIGVIVSDSLMFQRGDPKPSDPHMGHLYGLAMPLLKYGVPVEPVQLENVTIAGFLKRYRVLLMTYEGMKPLTPDVHQAISAWVKAGGVLVFWDDDADPFCAVREWWNSDGHDYATPRQHLWEQLGLRRDAEPGLAKAGKGVVLWTKEAASRLTRADGPERLVAAIRKAATDTGLRWKEANHLLLRRGPYVIAAGLDETIDGPARTLKGRFVSLFDADLRVQSSVVLNPGTRQFLVDLDRLPKRPGIVAAGCKALVQSASERVLRVHIEGIAATQGIILLRVPANATSVTLDAAPVPAEWNSGLLRVRFANEPRPRELIVKW
jgi:hypothetical protein